ncbi:hypothetical protein BDQ17DRAFT_1370232, partial [Cyathus striatus]
GWFSFFPLFSLPVTHSFSLFHLFVIHYTLIFLVLHLFLVPVPLLVHLRPFFGAVHTSFLPPPSSPLSIFYGAFVQKIYLPVSQTPSKVNFTRPPRILTVYRTPSSFRIESLCVLRLIGLSLAKGSETHHVVSNTVESTDSLTLRREAMV